MSEWKDCILSDIADIIPGFAFKGEHFGDQGEVVVKIKDITPPTISIQAAQRVDMAHYSISKLEKYKLRKGDYAIAMTGATIGKIGKLLEDEEAYINQRVAKVEAKSTVDHDYLYFCLLESSFDSFIQNNIDSHSAQENISGSSIGRYPINLPSLPEQKAIAAVLSSLDDKIDLLHRQNKTLEAMAETLFRQWFVEDAREEWEDTNLETHTEIFRGLSYKGSGLSDAGIGIPMHNLNSIYEGGGYKDAGIKYYSGEYKERHLVSPGDVIVANTEQGHNFRLIGFPAIVPSLYGKKGLFSQHLYRLILKGKSYLTTEYLYYLLMVPFVREQVISATNGSTVNMLAPDGLQRPEFKLPPKEKVADFSIMVRNWWKKKEINRSQIRTLEKLRDTLLPKLMSGEVRVAV